jgi:hypothetical protein
VCKNQFDGKMPGHYYGSNWDWVPCQTCKGNGTRMVITKEPAVSLADALAIVDAERAKDPDDDMSEGWTSLICDAIADALRTKAEGVKP